MRPRAVKLMKWILKYKGSCTDPIDFYTLVRESRPGCEDRTSAFLSGVNFKLERVDSLQEFEINDRVKLLYMLSHPVNEVFERMLRDDGSTLELTDGRLISYFRSADGTVERGVALPRNVKDEAGAPNLAKPKQEVVEQPAQPEAAEPVEEEMAEQPVVKMEAAEPVAQNVEVAQHHVEPIREVAQVQNSQNAQGEVVEPAVPNLPAAPANSVPEAAELVAQNVEGLNPPIVQSANSAQHHVEPIREVAQVQNSQNDQGEVADPAVPSLQNIYSIIYKNINGATPAQEVPTPNLAEPNREPATAPTPQEGPAEHTPCRGPPEPKQKVPSSQNDQEEVAGSDVQNCVAHQNPASIPAQEVPTPNLVEPNREVVNAPNPQQAPAEQAPAHGPLESKQEVPSSQNDQEEVAGSDVLNRVSHQNPVLVPAQEVSSPNLVEPNRETVNAMDHQETPAEQTPAHGPLEPKQEVSSSQNDQGAVSGPDALNRVAHQNPALNLAQEVPTLNLIEPNRKAVNAPNPQEVPSQNRNKKNKKRNRKRKNVESQASEADPVVAKVQRIAQLEEEGTQVEPIEGEAVKLSTIATDVLENLSNLSLAFEWSDEFALKAQDEIRKGRSDQKILRSKIQKVVDNTFEVLIEGASSKIPVSEDSIKFVHFLRVYRIWLRTTKYNSVQDIDNKMGEEIRAYDNREDGAPVKRIRIDKLLLVFGMWFNVATPAV